MKRERPYAYDREYKNRIMDAVLEAVMTTSIQEGPQGRSAYIKSGEVFDALQAVGAMFISGSDSLSSPTKIRAFCQEEAKVLQRLIIAAQEEKAKGAGPHFIDLPNTFDD